MRVYTGTSGFSYKAWRGSFYPADLSDKEMLRHYATQLGAVEVNNTFYRMPRESVLTDWGEKVPESFRFVIKAPQRITHRARLVNAGEALEYLCRTLEALGERLGPLLFQLPPNFKRDDERLGAFLELLPQGLQSAWEFRHASWDAPEVRDLLARHGAAECVADTDEAAAPELRRGASWGYVRLRRSSYDERELASWARRIKETGWERAYAFFKHEDGAAGPRWAADLAARF